MTLAYRIPNPPRVFVGRRAESQRLTRLLREGAVACVCGPGGIGKSALVRQLLQVVQPQWSADAIRVSMRDGETLDDVLKRLRQAQISGQELPPRGDSDTEPLTFDILNIAERDQRTVLVDNLHRASSTALLRFCTRLTDYAMHSRWILVARQFPEGMDSPEQLVRLAPLDEPSLRELAQRCGCDASDVHAAVAASNGSPLRLRQWVASRQQRGILGSAPLEARALLTVLARLDHAVSIEDAARLANLPAPSVLKALEDGGWLQQSALQSGLRMHDVIAEEVLDDLSADERMSGARRVATSFGAHTDPTAVASAVVATLDTGDLNALSLLLDAQGQRLLDRGRAAWLWRLLTQASHAQPQRWAYKAAVEARDIDAIAWLAEQPRPEQPELLELWLEGQLLNTRPLEVLSATNSLSPALTKTQKQGLYLQRARALMSLNHMEEVVETLTSVTGTSGDIAAVSDALLARAYLHLGDQVRALAVLRQANETTLSPRLRSIVDEQRNFVVMASGDATDGQRLVSSPESPNATPTSRLLLAAQYLMRGNLKVTREIVEKLKSQLVSAGERVLLALVQAALAMLDVNLAECRRHLIAAIHEAAENKLWMLYHSSVNAGLTLTSALRMESIQPQTRTPDAPPAAHNDLAVLDVLEQFWDMDAHGAPQPPKVPDLEKVSSMGTNSAARSLTEAMWARMEVIQGRFTSGDLLAVTALRRARDGGWPYVVGSALHELALTAAGRKDRATFGKAGDELRRIGEVGEMALYRQLGDVFDAMRGPHPDMARLDQLAGDLPDGPAGFWAKGVFGLSPTQRAYDRAGLKALQRLWGSQLVIGRTTDDWRDGWGFDTVVGHAWRLKGPLIKLSGRVARRLLTCLVRGAGRASKESLVTYAWTHRDYHPLRDDNRLHVAMRRLRKALDRLHFTVPLVQTTEDGYCINPEVPFAWATTVSAPSNGP